MKRLVKILFFSGLLYSMMVVVNQLVADMNGFAEDDITVELIAATNKTEVDYELTTRSQEPSVIQEGGVAYVQEGIGQWSNPRIIEAGKTTQLAVIIRGLVGSGQEVRLRPTCGGSYPTYYLKRGPQTSGTCSLDASRAPETILVSRGVDFADMIEQPDSSAAICRYPIHSIAYCGTESSQATIVFDADHCMIEPAGEMELLEQPVHAMALQSLALTDDADDDYDNSLAAV